MKHSRTFVATLSGIALLPQVGYTKPTPTPKLTEKPLIMPAEVRAMMAPGATTVRFARLSIGPRGAPILLHAWALKRRSSQTSLGVYVPSLYCVDLFYSDPSNGKKWEMTASTSYLSEGASYPGGITYKTRWLHPTTKQGLVLVETTRQATGGILRLITLPKGIENQPFFQRNAPFVQEFYTSHSGGARSVFISFGANKNGDLTVEEEILPHASVRQTKNTYAWKGERCVEVASERTE